MTMRLPADEAVYQDDIKNGRLRPLHKEKGVRDFVWWFIVENRYPHTRLAENNHLLVLKRKASLQDLTNDETAELLYILGLVGDDYDCVLYNLGNMSSIKDVPHFHLYNIKQGYK